MGGPSRPTNPLSGRLPFKSFTFGNALLSSVGQVLERRGQPTENLPKHKQTHSHARVTNQSDVEDFRSTAAVVMLCSTSYTDEISREKILFFSNRNYERLMRLHWEKEPFRFIFTGSIHF